jgi:hypothetical protein
MTAAELKRVVEDDTIEEQQYLFVCLSEKLCPHTPEELTELDRRSAELEAGKKRLLLEGFEERLDRSKEAKRAPAGNS